MPGSRQDSKEDSFYGGGGGQTASAKQRQQGRGRSPSPTSPTRTFSRRSRTPSPQPEKRREKPQQRVRSESRNSQPAAAVSPTYSDEFESDPEYDQHSKTALRDPEPEEPLKGPAKKSSPSSSSVPLGQSAQAAVKQIKAKKTVAGGRQNHHQQPHNQHRSSTQRSQQPGGPGGSRPHHLSPRQLDQATKRVMSAKNRKLAELKNELDYALKELNDLRTENRLLQKQNRINERALNKYDNEDSQLSQTIAKHQEEVRALKEQLRRYKDRCSEAGAKNKDLEAENTRLKKFNDRLREQASQEGLPDREALARRVNELEDDNAEKDKKIQDLERHLEHLQKNHRHEVAIEVHRHKDTQRKVRELEEQLQEATNALKEKEKILDIQNIYAQRAVRPPHHLNSSAGAGSVQNLRFNSASKSDNSTPRDKMKAYEEKRRQQLEDKRKKQKEVITEESPKDAPHNAKPEEELPEVVSDDDEAERQRQLEAEQAEAEERQRREAKERKRREEEEEEARRERQRMKQQLEEEAAHRRLEEEDRQRRLQTEREQEELEAQRREQQRLREQEEARQRELELEELRKKEEEERKRKATLLARLKELDMPPDEKPRGDEEADKKPPPHPAQQQRQRKQYDFKPSVENLHQGKPAYDNVAVPGYMLQQNGSTSGSRRESGSGVDNSAAAATGSVNSESAKALDRRAAEKAREEKMMADLFGGAADSPPSTKSEQRRSQASADRSDGESGGRRRRNGDADGSDPLAELLNGNAGSAYQPSSFAAGSTDGQRGGSGSSGKLLPRRPSASSGNRQAVGHSEDVDDIEEMML